MTKYRNVVRQSTLAGVSMLVLSACFSSDEDSSTSAPSSQFQPQAEMSDAAAFRFAQQATFGASTNDLETIKTAGFDAWIEAQFDTPYILYEDRVREEGETNWVSENTIQRLFWERAIHGDDQLRQRLTYALSQIVVVSLTDPQVRNQNRSFSVYADLLQEHALGNYCDLIGEVSFNPVMGLFLTHLGNPREDQETGFVPDENYAREVMQLFTIGLEDLDTQGRPSGRESYTGDDVSGLAAIFTGLGWADTDFFFPRVNDFNRYLRMESFLAQHEDAPKSFLGTTIDLGSDAVVSIDAALDHLLDHPNVAPFVSKQLIQKLVTSNPSPGYVGRVAEAFEAGSYRLASGTTVGAGKRCDLAATTAAILMDQEARNSPVDENFGKIRNPILRLSQLIRAFRVPNEVSRSGEIPQAWTLDRLEDGQAFGINAFVSPSVFNFFRPGYVGPGTESAEAGLVSPEYQISTTPALVGYINTMEDFIDGPPLSETSLNVAVMNTNELLTLADSPDGLIAEVNRIMTGGLMSTENVRALEAAVGDIPVAGGDLDADRRRRVELALLMAVTSPEFMVQR